MAISRIARSLLAGWPGSNPPCCHEPPMAFLRSTQLVEPSVSRSDSIPNDNTIVDSITINKKSQVKTVNFRRPREMFLSTMILFVISLAASVASQDANSIVFPATGNVSETSNKMEALPRADITHPTEPYLRPLTPNNFLPAPPRTFVSHRSELPYVYEHPNFAYPIAHSIDYPVGPSSKQLVVVSFIGLLLLFAIIQNTMASVKRRDVLTDVLSARDKRDLYAAYDFESANAEQKEVLADDARVRCIQRTVCLENRKLTRTFGAVGKVLAKYLTRSVGKSLKSTSGWDRLVQDAGEAGIREEDCDVLYRDCEEQTSSETSPEARDE